MGMLVTSTEQVDEDEDEFRFQLPAFHKSRQLPHCKAVKQCGDVGARGAWRCRSGGRTRCVTVIPGVDRLWIVTSGNGVLERRGEEFKHVLESQQIGVVARTTLADKQGRLWVGNERKLYCWDGRTRHALEIHAMALAEGRDGTIWAGDSSGGLCRIRAGVRVRE